MDEDDLIAAAEQDDSTTDGLDESDDGGGLDENGDPLEAETDENGDPIEQEPEQEGEVGPPSAEATPYRPQFESADEAETWLRENVDAETVRALDTIINARIGNSRRAEDASSRFTREIDEAAPGFLGAQERDALRQLPPAQQADPGAAFMVSALPYMQRAQQSGNVAEALDAFAAAWQTRRGRTAAVPKPKPSPLPPAQRVVSKPGGGGGPVTRPARTPAPRNEDTEVINFIKGLGVTDNREASRYAREI
jgi:hypothetical protein